MQRDLSRGNPLASEKSILNESLVALSAQPDTMLWRNNTGQAWQGLPVHTRVGQTVVVLPGMKILRDARPVQFGLLGSSDLLGVTRGIPLAVEVKDETGRQSTQQKNFEQAWTRVGGIYLLVRSVRDAVERVRSLQRHPLG